MEKNFFGNDCECAQESITRYDRANKWITGEISTLVGKIPQISTKPTFSDTLGGWKARWGINRINYKINPGLYAVGSLDDTSPVLVTANYKLTFDVVRKELADISVWPSKSGGYKRVYLLWNEGYNGDA